MTVEKGFTLKHVEEFDEFLRSEVNLDSKRLNLLHKRVQNVTEYLSQNLNLFEKRENQGSYALGTIIQPVNSQDYDSDILIYLKEERRMEPEDYVGELYTCLGKMRGYTAKLRKKNKSVEVNYNDDFHMDVVPCVVRGGQPYVCNSNANRFEPTDGTGYREWFNGKTDITNGHLKAATRLLKYMRNHKASFDVPSVVLTTLIGHSTHFNERGKRFSDVPGTLKVVSNRINAFLQATPAMPRFRNPALRSERFDKGWDKSQYRNFQANFEAYNKRINDAFEETNDDVSIQKWRNLFGRNFG